MTEQQKLTFTALQQRLDSLMLRDRLRFSRRLHGVKKVKNPDAPVSYTHLAIAR